MRPPRSPGALALLVFSLLAAPAVAQIEEEDIPATTEPALPAATPDLRTDPALPPPPSPGALVAEAERRYTEGDLEGAALLYRQAAGALPAGEEQYRLLVTLTTLELQLGQREQAVASLARLLTARPDYPVQPELYGADFVNLYFDARQRALEERSRLAEERVRAGVVRMEAGDFAAARGLFTEALVFRPNYPAALFDLALVAQRSGDAESAIAGFQKLLALAASAGDEVPPELYARSLQNVGILYYNRGFFEDAELHLTQASKLDPGEAGTWNNLGLARRRLGKIADATAAFHRAHELKRDDQAIINNLALAYMDAQNWLDSVGLLAEATRAHPDNASLWLNLGIANRGFGNPEGAQRALRRTMELDPENRQGMAARAATYLALTLQEKGDAAGAAAESRRALSWRPEDVQAWTYLGIAQQALQDLDGAKASLEQAQKLEPTSAEIANNLGSVYFRLGEYDRAETTFQRSLAMRPDFLAATENLEHTRRRQAELQTLRNRLGIGAVAPRQSPPSVGVVVGEVVPASPAARAELLPGDRIVLAQKVPLASPTTLFNLLEREPDMKTLALEIVRGGKQSRVKLRLK
jgi:tetratricopeptide (TPR) repeat protein